MTINGIKKSKTLHELVSAVESFCKENLVRENDEVCMELKEQLEFATQNDYLTLLSS